MKKLIFVLMMMISPIVISDEIGISILSNSVHLSDTDYCESNYGLFLGYNSYFVGAYRNSGCRMAYALGYSFSKPLPDIKNLFTTSPLIDVYGSIDVGLVYGYGISDNGRSYDSFSDPKTLPFITGTMVIMYDKSWKLNNHIFPGGLAWSVGYIWSFN